MWPDAVAGPEGGSAALPPRGLRQGCSGAVVWGSAVSSPGVGDGSADRFNS